MNVVAAFALLLLSAWAYAVWRGGAPERWTAFAFLIAHAATRMIQLTRLEYFQRLEVGILIIDALLLAFLIAVALKANRYWPIWMTALHASTVAVHLAKLMKPSIVPPVYGYGISFLSIPMLLILCWATFRHRRRLKRFGSDPPWRGF